MIMCSKWLWTQSKGLLSSNSEGQPDRTPQMPSFKMIHTTKSSTVPCSTWAYLFRWNTQSDLGMAVLVEGGSISRLANTTGLLNLSAGRKTCKAMWIAFFQEDNIIER